LRQIELAARRPAEYLQPVDPLRGKALEWRTMEDKRYLGGYAAQATNGRTSFTTETNGYTG